MTTVTGGNGRNPGVTGRLRRRLWGLAEAMAPADTSSGGSDPWAALVLDEVLRRIREEQGWLDRLTHRADDPTEEMP